MGEMRTLISWNMQPQLMLLKVLEKSSKRVQRSKGGCWDLPEYGTLSEQWLCTQPSPQRRLGEELGPAELQPGQTGKYI